MKTDPIKALVRALAKLAPDQDRAARRNARKRVLTAIKAVRVALDRDFPLVKPLPKKGVRQLTGPLIHARRWRARGWRSVPNPNIETLGILAVAGIRPRTLDRHNYMVPDNYMVPGWASMVLGAVNLSNNEKLAVLRKYRRDPSGQKAFMAETVLDNDLDGLP